MKLTACKIILLLLLAGCAHHAARPGDVTTIDITINGHVLKAETASSSLQRKRGLMGRKRLHEDSGMLFVFPVESFHRFWMKDTPMPLDIAFIDEAKAIVSIQHMEPLDETARYAPPVPVRYALETNRGWFEEHGIREGDKAEFDDSDFRKSIRENH